MTRLGKELASFQTLWEGGYYEGDPSDPLCRFPSYGVLNWMSSHHATYLRCIKPYIRKDTVALEIGPGRGCWTKTMLPAKEIYALDALPAEHNGFYSYLGHPPHVKYFQVDDFACEMLPENHFDYMFSFGCLCHVSFEGITAYAQNLYSKLKSGANCFWMVATMINITALKGRSLETTQDWSTTYCLTHGFGMSCVHALPSNLQNKNCTIFLLT